MDRPTRLKAVRILESDGDIIRNWTKLYNQLLPDSSDGDVLFLVNAVRQQTCSHYELFDHMLTVWVSRSGKEATVEKLCRELKEIHFKDAAEKIHTVCHAIPDGGIFLIPRQTGNFKGRPEEVLKLREWMDMKKSLVKITGLGGVGKTELAKQFAESCRDVANCVWLDGGSEEAMIYSLRQFAKTMQLLPPESFQAMNLVHLVRCIICEIERRFNLLTLFIFDNLNFSNVSIDNLLIEITSWPKNFVVVTTTNLEVLGAEWEALHLDDLNHAFAYGLVEDLLTGEQEDSIRQLCLLLSNIPLALQQAIAYIKYHKRCSLQGSTYSIDNYIDEFKNEASNLLTFQLNSIHHRYRETVFGVWKFSIERMRTIKPVGDISYELLGLMTYCLPQYIPSMLIQRWWRETGWQSNDKDFNEAMALLKQHCLIKAEECKIYIPSLFQRVHQLILKSDFVETNLLKKWMSSATYLLENFSCEEIVHFVSIWEHCSKHETLVQQFAFLPAKITGKLRDLSLYSDMLDFARNNYDILQKTDGRYELQTIAMETFIAEALMWNEKYDESLEFYERAHQKLSQKLPEDHDDILWIRNNMATVLHNIGKIEEALKLHQSVFEMKERKRLSSS